MTDKPQPDFKILELRAEGIKRLQVVEIKPDGNLVEITGRNGQGKTSVLDSIWWAMTGGRNIQTTPIRKGLEKALIKLDLGELVVTRTFNAQEDGSFTTALKVEDALGAPYSGPQGVLDAIIGDLSFDPLGFQRMKPKEQYDTLRGFVPGVDFEQLDRLNKGDFDKRTDINRQEKSARAQADGLTIPDDVPDAPVDVSKVSQQLRDAQQSNAEVEGRKARREQAVESIAAKRAEVERLTIEADHLQAQLDEADALPDIVDTEELTRQITEAGSINEAVARKRRKADLIAEADALKKQSDDLTAAITAREKEKADAIQKAELPVDGLSFGDGCVLLNGVPFEQGSDAEQLRASIAIAGALNPRLRVIRVRDGSLLDEDAMGWLAEYAEEKNMQVWLERVDSSGRHGFVLEDGMIKAREVEEALD